MVDMNNQELSKAYVASEHESTIYEKWESAGAFKPSIDPQKESYCIVMPPPNANGNLHLGHALMVTLEDILIRYHRLKGFRTLWVPGSDHAGFETQVVFEKKLEKEGRSRFQMTQEQFRKETMDFTLENKKNMEDQVRMLGASCDWSKERFTLDSSVVSEVYKLFRKMYEEGLIYRGERIVNYSVKYQTAYSDIEVLHEERKDSLYYLKYGPLVVATVRPETTFGDVAVAVNPKDKRYQQYIGTEIEVQFATGETKKLPVIADEYVDIKFGTGALKITPAHDPNDFEIGQKYNLPIIHTINTKGRLTEVAGEFAGMKVAEARVKVVERLSEMGLIEKIDENYIHTVALCYKSNTLIEPLVMPQWYVKVGDLAKRAIKAIEDGEIEFHPAGYKKIQIDWLKNLRDWNISRQIWWGIPIKDAMPEIKEIADDPDTFDTWFSSSQWPYVVLKTIQDDTKVDYLADYYPNSVMETGRDLIFAWIPRMIMLGLYTQNKVPFKKVYLHGLVLDKHGKKMSKSKGNVISPVEMVAKYGSDATRFGLTIGGAAGSDIPAPEEKIIGGRNFANKLWNISRFVMMQAENEESLKGAFKAKTEADKEILDLLKKLEKEVEKHLAVFRFSQALQAIHEFVWHKFADVYIEQSKKQLDGEKIDQNTIKILYYVLRRSLIILHPFMPFVTESIYQNLPEEGMLIVADWEDKPNS